MSFDPHDPEVEQLMHERALAQGDRIHSRGHTVVHAHTGTVLVKDGHRTLSPHEQLERALEQALLEASRALLAELDAWARKAKPLLQGIIDQMPVLQRTKHGHAARCPRHGLTRGGTCIKCYRRT